VHTLGQRIRPFVVVQRIRRWIVSQHWDPGSFPVYSARKTCRWFIRCPLLASMVKRQAIAGQARSSTGYQLVRALRLLLVLSFINGSAGRHPDWKLQPRYKCLCQGLPAGVLQVGHRKNQIFFLLVSATSRHLRIEFKTAPLVFNREPGSGCGPQESEKKWVAIRSVISAPFSRFSWAGNSVLQHAPAKRISQL